MRRKQLQPWVGLPNILCESFVVPELLQEAATPERLSAATLDWLDAREQDPARLQDLDRRFTELHQHLCCDTSQLAAHAIQTVLSA